MTTVPSDRPADGDAARSEATLSDAARFIAGEMTDAEAERYEATLGEPGVAEALSDAVRLRDALTGNDRPASLRPASLRPASLRPAAPRRLRTAAATAAAIAAACGLTAFAVWQPAGWQPAGWQPEDGLPGDATPYAAVWIEDAAANDSEAFDLWSDETDAGLWTVDGRRTGEAGDEPDWMLSVAIPEWDVDQTPPGNGDPGLETL